MYFAGLLPCWTLMFKFKNGFELAKTASKCKCTAYDFLCDFGYNRKDPDSPECVPDPAFKSSGKKICEQRRELTFCRSQRHLHRRKWGRNRLKRIFKNSRRRMRRITTFRSWKTILQIHPFFAQFSKFYFSAALRTIFTENLKTRLPSFLTKISQTTTFQRSIRRLFKTAPPLASSATIRRTKITTW